MIHHYFKSIPNPTLFITSVHGQCSNITFICCVWAKAFDSTDNIRTLSIPIPISRRRHTQYSHIRITLSSISVNRQYMYVDDQDLPPHCWPIIQIDVHTKVNRPMSWIYITLINLTFPFLIIRVSLMQVENWMINVYMSRRETLTPSTKS